MKLQINERFRDLCPVLSESERDQLQRNLVAYGCREPLCVWNDTIIDGHNRYAICTANNIPFKVREMKFRNEEAACNFIILNQLGRRNLDPKTASMLRGKLYHSRKKAEHDGGKGKTRSGDQNDPHSEKTAETIAKEYNVSPATVKRDAKFADACDLLSEMVKSGDISQEERRAIMEKPKTAIAKAAASLEVARKIARQKKKTPQPRPKKTIYERLIDLFNRLDGSDMGKALEEMQNIYDHS